MAPKFKFTKEEVLTVTIDFIRENGIEALTARELAKKLESSTKVIFSLFSNMKNLEDEAKIAVENIFSKSYFDYAKPSSLIYFFIKFFLSHLIINRNR